MCHKKLEDINNIKEGENKDIRTLGAKQRILNYMYWTILTCATWYYGISS